MTKLLPVNTLWIGTELGLLERACLRSFLHAGHPVHLFVYESTGGVPEGVEVHDARDVLPESKILRHKSGSVALFSDYFRYKLQSLGAGYWVDADIYCLKPLDFREPLVFGWESEDHYNSAVLRLPEKSELLEALLSIFEERRLPAWLPFRERIGFAIDKKQSARFPFWARVSAALRWSFARRDLTRDLPWGAAGPRAITHCVDLLGLTDKVQARQVFYPVRYQDAGWIVDPEKSLESMITVSTHTIHLWNSLLSHVKSGPAPAGSFIERLNREGAY